VTEKKVNPWGHVNKGMPIYQIAKPEHCLILFDVMNPNMADKKENEVSFSGTYLCNTAKPLRERDFVFGPLIEPNDQSLQKQGWK